MSNQNCGSNSLINNLPSFKLLFLSLGLSAALSACNGGSSPTSATTTGPVSTAYTAGVFAPSSTFINRCAAPRSGTDPITNKRYPDVAGSAAIENFWLRSWTHELYLWYREVPDLNPNNYADPVNSYFPLLKTAAITTSGKDKDKFHFVNDTAQWESFSGSGVSAGYGVEWIIVQNFPPRQVVAAYTEPNSSPAAMNSISRGEKILSVDGVDIVNDNTLTHWPEGMFPTATNESHTFVLQALNGSQRTVTMTSANITSTPVQNVGVIPGTNGQVGYIQFNDHIATAEQQFISAVTLLNNAGISDLVLDLRYNGGGYLDLASEIAYMIAGGTQTAGKIFEQATFNDQNPVSVNPVTGGSNPATPFHNTTQGFSTTAGIALPVLNLDRTLNRVFVLTGTGTCSASEAIINSLRGIGMTVIQVGSTTCGKPYGFYPQDNCGTTYFSIELKGNNNVGFGDYTDGFSPANSLTANSGVSVPGCSVADDFTHQLGDPAERRLAAALLYRTSTSCPVGGPTGISGRSQIQSASDQVDLSNAEGTMFKQPFRENRIMRQ